MTRLIALAGLVTACGRPAPPAVAATPAPVAFQQSRLALPPGATVSRNDASGLEVGLGGEGSRCGPSTARLEYVARDGAIPEPVSTTTGTHCEDHTLIRHDDLGKGILARFTCTERGELEGATPTLCSTVAAELSHGAPQVDPPPATAWSVRPAFAPGDRPERVEYFKPGASIWFPGASHRTLELAPGVEAGVLVDDVHHSGDNTVFYASLDGGPETVVFEHYVLGLEPAGPATGPGPVDLRVTIKDEPEPMMAVARCTLWRFDGTAYQDTAAECGYQQIPTGLTPERFT